MRRFEVNLLKAHLYYVRRKEGYAMNNQYANDGYIVLRQCVQPQQIRSLTSLVEKMDLNRRKPNLMGNDELIARINAIMRRRFGDIETAVGELVELAALVAKNGKPVKLGWHKDRPQAGGRHAFQLPLLAGDRFHELVPGSHSRDLTQGEIAARNAGGETMPGCVTIELAIGDVLLRSPFILHRGYNQHGINRLTIVGAYS